MKSRNNKCTVTGAFGDDEYNHLLSNFMWPAIGRVFMQSGTPLFYLIIMAVANSIFLWGLSIHTKLGINPIRMFASSSLHWLLHLPWHVAYLLTLPTHFQACMRKRDPHRANVENILAICLPNVTMQHIKESSPAMQFMGISAWNGSEMQWLIAPTSELTLRGKLIQNKHLVHQVGLRNLMSSIL